MSKSVDEWIRQYQEKGALWLHDGNPLRPHALLTSGKHSNGFFNSELVMEDSYLLDEVCIDLVNLLRKEQNFIIDEVDRIVGPAMGAITLAHDIARHIGQRRLRPCLRAYTEKETKVFVMRKGEEKFIDYTELAEGDTILRHQNKSMVFKKTTIRSGECVLAVEDVLTTGGSVDLTVAAVTKAGGTALPFVAVIVNRSSLTEVNGKKIVALIDRPMPMWTPEECPLCKEGSEAIRPKGTENWARLNAAY